MSEKPEALVLADAFETYAVIPPGLQRVAAIPCVVSRTELSQAATELRRLNAENEALRRDAERYRWLRDNAAGFSGRTLDSITDAALRREDV